METKICSKCKIEKEVCNFYTDKSKPDGLYNSCKECKKNYFNTRKVEVKKYLELWRQNNPNNSKKFRTENPNYVKDYYKKNKQKLLENSKKHYENNKQKILEKYRKISKKYYEDNREKRLEYRKIYNKNNRDKHNMYVKNKKLNDPIYYISNIARNRVLTFLKRKNIEKNNKTFDIIGCSPEFLKEHIEKQFKQGMNWDNCGLYGWHIDHIIPLSSAKTEEEIYKLCHYTNLQPLWAKENLSKGRKIL